MTSIHDLPDEILLEIVASIDRDPYHREFKTYRALCSTSRRLYKIAVPLLYERYELSGWETSRNRDGEYKSHGVFSERQRSRHHFVRTLAASPELANLVKSIRYANEQDPWRPFVCDDHMLDKMVYKIRGKHAPPQAVLALMLCLTQNVEAIDVRNNTQQPFSIFVGLEPVFKAALGISFSSVHQFKHLKSITVDYSSTRLINLMPLFKLSSIRKLSFKSCTWKPYPNALATIYTLSPLETALFEREYRSSPVTSIILEGLVPAPLLKGILLCIAALEHFHYHGFAFLNQDHSWFSSLSLALDQHHTTLECICFDQVRWNEYDSGYWNHLSHSGCGIQLLQFRSPFSRLKTLRVPISSILSWKTRNMPNQLVALSTVLPPTIEDLRLEYHGDWDPALFFDSSTLSLDHAALPNLKNLELRYQPCMFHWNSFVRIRLAQIRATTNEASHFLLDFKRIASSSYECIVRDVHRSSQGGHAHAGYISFWNDGTQYSPY